MVYLCHSFFIYTYSTLIHDDNIFDKWIITAWFSDALLFILLPSLLIWFYLAYIPLCNGTSNRILGPQHLYIDTDVYSGGAMCVIDIDCIYNMGPRQSPCINIKCDDANSNSLYIGTEYNGSSIYCCNSLYYFNSCGSSRSLTVMGRTVKHQVVPSHHARSMSNRI